MSWNGVKRQSIKAEIEDWCEKMGIENYTINSQGEIDVDGYVNLDGRNIKELPYKFGRVASYFSVNNCSLISLKNCPDILYDFFDCNNNEDLDSLKYIPKKVDGNIHCRDCKRRFTEEEVRSLCEVDVRCLIYN